MLSVPRPAVLSVPRLSCVRAYGEGRSMRRVARPAAFGIWRGPGLAGARMTAGTSRQRQRDELRMRAAAYQSEFAHSPPRETRVS